MKEKIFQGFFMFVDKGRKAAQNTGFPAALL
jgi:hypothetical protein